MPSPPSHFFQKHLAYKYGDISEVYERIDIELSGAPYAVTEKDQRIVDEATHYNKVWVIEVKRVNNETRYYLAYWFICSLKTSPVPSLIPKGYKHMLTVNEFEPISGQYFKEPVRITDPDVHDWLADEKWGFNRVDCKAINHFNTLVETHKAEMHNFIRK
ncbi:hypothetical protein RI848_001191 [Vibrio parahaemolyticus]|nr:hypothetical protein [Vibrio parahaemolyticus]